MGPTQGAVGPTQGWPGRCPARCWDAERTGRGRTFEVCPGLWWRLQRVAWRHRCEGTSGVVTCLLLGPPRAAGTAGAVPFVRTGRAQLLDFFVPQALLGRLRHGTAPITGRWLRFRRTSTISGSRLRPIRGRPLPTIWPLPLSSSDPPALPGAPIPHDSRDRSYRKGRRERRSGPRLSGNDSAGTGRRSTGRAAPLAMA